MAEANVSAFFKGKTKEKNSSLTKMNERRIHLANFCSSKGVNEQKIFCCVRFFSSPFLTDAIYFLVTNVMKEVPLKYKICKNSSVTSVWSGPEIFRLGYGGSGLLGLSGFSFQFYCICMQQFLQKIQF